MSSLNETENIAEGARLPSYMLVPTVAEEPVQLETEFCRVSPSRVSVEGEGAEEEPDAGRERAARKSRRVRLAVEKGSKKRKLKITVDDERHRTPLTERLAHTSNTVTLLASCNATPFKGLHSRGFRCFYCPESFKEPDLLRRHSKDHLKHKQFESPAFVTDEYVLYLDITALACDLCAEPMGDLNALRTHLTKVHDKILYEQFGDRIIPFVLRNEAPHDCQRCSNKFDTFVSLERHMNTHYRNFVCDSCGSGYITSKRLRTHAAFSHSTGNFPCASCKKVFTSATKVKKHTESVHMQKSRFNCPQCPLKFFKYFQRQSHLAKEHNASTAAHQCGLCNKIFQLKDSLNKHTRKEHLLERDHACTQCGFTCFTSTGLRNHMVSHTGERTYQCEICKKSYARKNTLRQHMRIHNDDRRYTCSVCGYAFVQNCSLKSHIRTHHPDSAQVTQVRAC